MTKSILPKLRNIKAVIFDMDGTLCIPQPWMFPAMRQAINLHDNSMDILTFIDLLPSDAEKQWAHQQLSKVEFKAMKEMVPQPGMSKLFNYLNERTIAKSICTRNLITPVNYLIDNFVPVPLNEFKHIVTREFRPTKPHPDPLLHIIQQLSLNPCEVMMVGDSYDDMKSGRQAGCITILLRNNINTHLTSEHQDLIDETVSDLSEIIDIIECLSANN